MNLRENEIPPEYKTEFFVKEYPSMFFKVHQLTLSTEICCVVSREKSRENQPASTWAAGLSSPSFSLSPVRSASRCNYRASKQSMIGNFTLKMTS